MKLLTSFNIALMGTALGKTQAASSNSPRFLHRLQNHTFTHSPSHTYSESTFNIDPVSQKNIYYTDNWSGGVLLASKLTETPTLTSVAATITVPVPTPSSTRVQAASAWVGIDGFVNTGAILQTGIDIVAFKGATGGQEAHSYSAWYEWYPQDAVGFDDDLAVEAGDVLVLSVFSTSTSGLTGVAIIQNQSTGQNVSATVQGPAGAALSGQSVEWIVEDYMTGGSLVSFVDFGTVTFEGAVTGAEGNLTFGVGEDGVNVDIVDLVDVDENKIVAKASIVGDGVTVIYQ
ncbi:peptidase A4 family-domain-containing protein [Aspergillus fruticulosus]